MNNRRAAKTLNQIHFGIYWRLFWAAIFFPNNRNDLISDAHKSGTECFLLPTGGEHWWSWSWFPFLTFEAIYIWHPQNFGLIRPPSHLSLSHLHNLSVLPQYKVAQCGLHIWMAPFSNNLIRQWMFFLTFLSFTWWGKFQKKENWKGTANNSLAPKTE